MKTPTPYFVIRLTAIVSLFFAVVSISAQTGDPELDLQLAQTKTLTTNNLVFGYSHPTASNKLILNNGAINLSISSTGWFKDDGSHAVSNSNYLAGLFANNFRNFFSVDLSGITGPVTQAVLQIQKFTSVPSTGYSVWQLSDVMASNSAINTDYSAGSGNLPEGLAIYDDLGGGISFGTDTIDGGLSSNTIISIELNSDAVALLNGSIGGYFIIGGRCDTYLPHLPPMVTTVSATDIMITSATLNGTVNPNGTATSVSFVYGTTSGNLLSEVAVIPGTFSGNSSYPVNANIDNLQSNTTYYYQIMATNADLVTVYGQEYSFTTNADLVHPPIPEVESPQHFCSTASIHDIAVHPPAGCIVYWYDSSTGGIILPDSYSLTSGQTYYAESFNPGTGLSSLNRSAVSILIDPSPTPILAGPNKVCLNSDITLFSTDPGMASYYWTVSSGCSIVSGGGITDNTISIRWIASGAETLEVNYTTTEGCSGLQPTVKSVEVAELPVPSINGSSMVCQGQEVVTYRTEPGMINYIWWISEGGVVIAGGTPESDSIMVRWNNPGIQSLSVRYSNESGCMAAEPSILQVLVQNQETPLISGQSNVCESSGDVVYTANPGMSNYAWVVSDGGMILSGQSTNEVVVLWKRSGVQSVSVTFDNPSGCSVVNSASYPVMVNPLPVPKILGPSEVCANSESTFYSTDPGMTAYVWIIPAGGLVLSGAGTDQIEVSWNSPGQYLVSVSYLSQDGCQPHEASLLPVFANAIPDPAQRINGETKICSGSSGHYYVSPIRYAENYVWILPEGANILSGAGTNSIEVGYLANAVSGEIVVYGENSCGSGQPSAVLAVAVMNLPGDAGEISGPKTVCSTETEATYSVTSISDAARYIWTIPEGVLITSGENTNVIHVLFTDHSTSGNFTVVGINQCGKGNRSGDYFVTVSDVPLAPVISLRGDLLRSSATEGNQWFMNGYPIPGATSQEYQVIENGTYWCVVTSGVCSSAPSNSIDVVLTSMTEASVVSFSIYPVPNHGSFTIRSGEEKTADMKLIIYNSLGSVVYEKEGIPWRENSTFAVDLPNVVSGTYAVVLEGEHCHQMRSMIITK